MGSGSGEPMDPKEIADGKVLAALGYPIWIIALVMLFVRNNAFTLFHAKQMMTLVVVQLALCIPLMVLSCIITAAMGAAAGQSGAAGSAVGIFGCLIWVVFILVGLASLALIIIGLINAINGQAKPLPVIGKYADKLFGKMTKKTV